MMDQSHDFRPRVKRDVTLRTTLLALGGAFLLGVAATWALSGNDAMSGLFSIRADDSAEPVAEPVALASDDMAEPQPSPSASGSGEVQEAREAVEQVVEQQGGLDSRVAAMEQRLTRLDIEAQSAAGNAARAEALLIAFAARRAIERGLPLGYLSDQLRLRFGEDRPNAVQTVIDASQDPVTLPQLLAQLEGLAPELDDAPDGEGVFTRLGRELSELFVVRREETASPVSERRLERARQFLENGRVGPAVAEIRELPNALAAEAWIEDAERYAGAQRALETLETAAVLDPRELRDGEGAQVRQRSPAGNARR